jgi:hypothetical protein
MSTPSWRAANWDRFSEVRAILALASAINWLAAAQEATAHP